MRHKNIFGLFLLIFFWMQASSQSRFLTGTIKMKGQPVNGLTVYTTFASAQTDDLGRYALPLAGCLSCKPGYELTLFTWGDDPGSSEQEYTINDDYRFDFVIEPGRIVLNGMVVSTGGDPFPLARIDVTVIAGDIDVSPVKTNRFGEFKIPVSRALLEGTNAIRLQVQDPEKRYKPLRPEPELYSINSFITIKMEPSRSSSVKVSGLTSTQICVKKDDLVTIEATGQIRIGFFTGTSDPDGRSAGVGSFSLEAFNIVPRFNHAALMYRLQGQVNWQVAGKRKRFTATRDGCIEFEINDSIQDDNEGSYEVEVSVQSN